MNSRAWMKTYLEQYLSGLRDEAVMEDIATLAALLAQVRAKGKQAIVAGNGGSAAIASHCAVDFTKNTGVRCLNFNEASLITCFANDYGYEHWLEKALEFYSDQGDVVILISSSGRSPNMVHAGRFAIEQQRRLVTFTGFRPDNPLRALGQLNFWVPSESYNIVEMTHHIWLLAACDLLVAEAAAPAEEVVAAPTSRRREKMRVR